MISRKLAGASAAGVGAATAVAALLLGTVSGSAAGETASAYGLAAEGLVPIEPTPFVQAPPDGEDALLEVPSPLGVGVLKVKAAGNTSSATAVDLDIADVIEAKIIEATCDNGVGDAAIIGGDIAGDTLPSDPSVGEELDLSPIAKVTFNRQSQNDDGTLTVDALVVAVLPGGQGDLRVSATDLDQLKGLAPNLEIPTMEQLQAEQEPTAAEPAAPTVDELVTALEKLNPGVVVPTVNGDSLLDIVISSATCGAGKAPPEAPKPKPVETKLPVTH